MKLGHNMEHNDIYSIVERLRILEEGLDKNQRSVNQLGPTFKPKTVAVLTAKKDPKNPMAGKLVGGSESAEPSAKSNMIETMKQVEEETSSDMLEKVKASFTDYLANLEDTIKQDKDLLAKKKEDFNLKKKELKDLELQQKQIKKQHQETVAEDPTQEEPVGSATGELTNPVYDECGAPIATIMIDENTMCEIHGDEHAGFEVRHAGRSLPTKFHNIDDAKMAIDMFKARRSARQDPSQDYIEEK